MTADGGRPFRILMVCTANQYRSPLAEFFMAQALSDTGLDWIVESAGTAARSGEPLPARVISLLEARSVLSLPWKSHRLTEAAIERADLILTAEHDHRRHIVTVSPGSLRRTFLLAQFARLAEINSAEGGSEDGARLVRAVTAARGHLQPVPDRVDEVPDPVGRPNRVLRHCADQIEHAVKQIVHACRAEEMQV